MIGYHVVVRYKLQGKDEFHLGSAHFSDLQRAAWQRDRLQERYDRMRAKSEAASGHPFSVVFRFCVEEEQVEDCCYGDQISREQQIAMWTDYDEFCDQVATGEIR